MNQAIRSLTHSFVQHLQREEQLLESLHQVARELRESLTSHEVHGEDLVRRHADVLACAETISAERSSLAKQLAKALDVPEQSATLGLLLQHCDPESGATLRDFQERLRQAAEGLSGSLSTTGNLALQMLDILEHVFRSLSGDQGSAMVYECNGRRNVA